MLYLFLANFWRLQCKRLFVMALLAEASDGADVAYHSRIDGLLMPRK